MPHRSPDETDAAGSLDGEWVSGSDGESTVGGAASDRDEAGANAALAAGSLGLGPLGRAVWNSGQDGAGGGDFGQYSPAVVGGSRGMPIFIGATSSDEDDGPRAGQ